MEVATVEVKVGGAFGAVIKAEVGETTNCYVVKADRGREGYIIDPGGGLEKIIEAAEGVDVKAVILTHVHYDHSKMCCEAAEKYNAPCWLHEGEYKFFEKSVDRFLEPLKKVKGFSFIKAGDLLQLGDEALEVIHTPGHSLGSICLYDNKGNIFTGDTLFAGAIGRYTHSGAYEEDLKKSIAKLAKLPDDTIVYPGHGPKTTIGAERHLLNP